MTTRKNFMERIIDRQHQAVERQKYWAALTLEEQLTSLDDRNEPAVRQRARIAAALQAREDRE